MKIEAYGMDDCVWCDRLKTYLDTKYLKYRYHTIDVTDPDNEGTKLFVENGLRSVPQVWINDQHIGGYEKTVRFLEDILVEH